MTEVGTIKRINITELAKLFECSVVTIRVWESRGIIPKAYRSLTNRRMYSRDDVEEIKKLIQKFHSRKVYNLGRKG